MNIVLKNSLKNIFGKPFRTLLVVFAIFVCSLCAMFCFDLGSSVTSILTNYMGSISSADFMASSSGSDMTNLPDGFPECETMSIVANSELIYKKIDGEYCYVTTEKLMIYGIDVDEAVSMKFISKIELNKGEILLSKVFAEKNGYKTGDKITIHDRLKEEVELTVAGILPEESKNPLLQGNKAIVNLDTSDMISCGDREADILMIDVKDNNRIKEAEDLLKTAYPDVDTTDLFLSDSDMAMLDEFRAIFYMLFAITFLLVIFVTASICNRIVSERMSFIGTLRSLGMSTARTGRILLLENVLYAVLGSVPAVALYTVIRRPMFDSLFITEGDGVALRFEIPQLSIALVLGVIFGAILIECLIPLKAILNALKTSIRDIIFDNRDTEYKFSRSTFVMGIICLVIAVVTFFFRSNILCAILCLLTAVGALAFLFPRLLRLVSKLIQKISDKNDKSAWSLAAVETVSRKSTVGSGVLSATAAAMCIVVYAIAAAMAGSLETMPYDCEVIMEANKQAKYYTYIEHLDGVTGVEAIYKTAMEYHLNDVDKSMAGYFYGFPEEGYKVFTGFSDAPEKLEEGNVLIDKKLANRKGIKEGDKLKVTIAPDSVFPIEREYTVQKIVEGNPNDSGIEAIIIPLKEYKLLFNDTPGCFLISCDDADKVKKDLETYAKGSYASVDTVTELMEKSQQNSKQTMTVIVSIIVVALGMTAIGMISNQLIGFEGRKKECAVLLSTAMNKAKLSGILLKEVLITSITASGVGTIAGTLLTLVIKAALDNTETLILDVTVDPVKNLIFFVVLTLVFTGTVLFPIRNLRKMKISEQIKYE